MTKKKSVLSLILAACLCFMLAMPAWAADSADTSNMAGNEEASEFPNSEEMARLVEVAKAVEHGKETWGDGCADIDFSKLTVGKKIREYIYTDNGFEEAGVAYPIVYNDKLFLLAKQNSDGGFNTAGTVIEKKISEYIDTDTNFAFVYDRTTCYLYDGINWVKLYQYPENQERPLLNPMARIDTADIRTTNIEESIPLNLNFTEAQSDTRKIWWNLPIRGVRQETDDICWAAACATIINYLKGTSLTSIDVAKAYFGDNYDQGLDLTEADDVLAIYGLTNYTKTPGKLNGDIIAANLARNYPVYADFRAGDRGHILVAYYMNGALTELKAWDPEIGDRTMEYNTTKGTFEYEYDKGVYYEISRGVCPIH